MDKSARKSNVELMRIVAMVMILIHHFCGQIIGLQWFAMGGGNYVEVDSWNEIMLIESFDIVAVNLFVLISGYFGIKFKIKTILKFLFIVFCFLLLHTLISPLYLQTNISIKTIIKEITSPISLNTAWFVRDYFILMLLSPMLNKVFDHMEKKEMLLYFIILSLINIYFGFFRGLYINEDGYNISQMIFIYFIGKVLRQTAVEKICRKSYLLFGYVVLSCLLFCLMMASLNVWGGEKAFKLLRYNNPIIIFSAICLFLFFVKSEFVSRKVNFIAAGAFGVYLIHQYRPFWLQFVVPNLQHYYANHSQIETIAIFILVSALFLILGSILCILFGKLFTFIYGLNPVSVLKQKISKVIKLNI